MFKYWAQFYNKRMRDEGPYYVEAVGSDQLIYFDRRWSRSHMEDEAAKVCKQRGYDGWRLVRGSSLLNPFYLNAAVKPVEK